MDPSTLKIVSVATATLLLLCTPEEGDSMLWSNTANDSVTVENTGGNPVIFKKITQRQGLFSPKTEMGKAMWEARKAILESDEPLMDSRELLEEFFRTRNS